MDSVVVKSFSVFDQETSTTNDFTASHIEMHGRIKLTKAEISTLSAYMISKASYRNVHAVLNNVDISIEYYVKDSVRQYIYISSLTKNINIYRYGCAGQTVNDKDVHAKGAKESCVFEKQVSPQFYSFLKNLFVKKGLWNK